MHRGEERDGRARLLRVLDERHVLPPHGDRLRAEERVGEQQRVQRPVVARRAHVSIAVDRTVYVTAEHGEERVERRNLARRARAAQLRRRLRVGQDFPDRVSEAARRAAAHHFGAMREERARVVALGGLRPHVGEEVVRAEAGRADEQRAHTREVDVAEDRLQQRLVEFVVRALSAAVPATALARDGHDDLGASEGERGRDQAQVRDAWLQYKHRHVGVLGRVGRVGEARKRERVPLQLCDDDRAVELEVEGVEGAEFNKRILLRVAPAQP
mmetsp:Transcript_6574/g.20688  ORF Transcript_6574/g.20688 Transcript_6574/m.20688 type:complete len:271 (-) Transcript_6574:262-1074(-)